MAGIFQQLFGGNSSTQTAATQAATATQTNVQQGVNVAQQTQQTADTNSQQTQQTQQQNAGAVNQQNVTGSPLDNYMAIWNTAPTASKQDNLQSDVIPLGADQLQALQQKVSNVNFLGGVQQEVITAALNGDVAAFTSVINSAVQQALMQSVRVNGAMINNGFRNRTQDILAAMPQHVQQALVTNQIRQDNPVFNHPAARQVLGALEQNLATNHPGISPSEASQVAQRFLQDFAAEISGKPTGSQATDAIQAPGQIDWSAMFK